MAPFRIAILWRGDREARRTASAQNNRYHRIFEELSGLGIHAEPAVYDEEFADEVCEQLLKVDGVLVWVDPLSRGKTRALLDPMLRDVASRGPWISAHPDVILKMGTKEVLYRTATEFDAMFPSRLQSDGPRVLKQNRGNDGQGVWKVEPASAPTDAANVVRVLHALRGSVPEELPLTEFMSRCETYFASGGMGVVMSAPVPECRRSGDSDVPQIRRSNRDTRHRA